MPLHIWGACGVGKSQIAWSHDLDKYLPLLAQFSALQNRIDQVLRIGVLKNLVDEMMQAAPSSSAAIRAREGIPLFWIRSLLAARA